MVENSLDMAMFEYYSILAGRESWRFEACFQNMLEKTKTWNIAICDIGKDSPFWTLVHLYARLSCEDRLYYSIYSMQHPTGVFFLEVTENSLLLIRIWAIPSVWCE